MRKHHTEHYSAEELDALGDVMDKEPSLWTKELDVKTVHEQRTLEEMQHAQWQEEVAREEEQRREAVDLDVDLLPEVPNVLAELVQDFQNYKENKQREQRYKGHAASSTSGNSSSALPEVDTSKPFNC